MTPIPLAYRLRAVAGTFFRRRMRQARSQFLAAAGSDCRSTQKALLRNLLELNEQSAFSKDFGLSASMTQAEFRQRIPVADYEVVRPYVNRVALGEHSALLGDANRLLMFAITSGTTAESKLIPVTTRFLNDYRHGWQLWGIGTYSEHAILQKLNIVQISSSHRKFETDSGTPCGNISGLVATMQNPIVRTLYTIPASVAEVIEAEARRYTILRLALADPFLGMLITANPSTLLQLCEHATSRAEDLIRDIHDGGIRGCELPDAIRSALKHHFKPSRARAAYLQKILAEFGSLRPRQCWPLLEVLGVWCGGSAAAYIPRIRELFDNIDVRDHGLHASEGRMTLPLEDNSSAGVLEIQTHFFEFIPTREAESSNPIVLEAHELKDGDEYFILLTTSSGLYRYNIQDVVRCVGFYGTSPILEFRHKGAHISSITGEKIAESQVVESVRAGAVATGFDPRLFTLTPCWGDPPGYTLFVQLADPSVAGTESPLNLFSLAVDEELRRRNLEYREKRETSRLRGITTVVLDASLWRQFSESRQAKAGGSPEQYKHPCLIPDPHFRNLFLTACNPGNRSGQGRHADEAMP